MALTLDDHPVTLIEIYRHGPAVLAKVKLGAGHFLFSLHDTTGPQVRYIVTEEIKHTLRASLVGRHPDALLDHPLLKRAEYSISAVTSHQSRDVPRSLVDLQCASATAFNARIVMELTTSRESMLKRYSAMMEAPSTTTNDGGLPSIGPAPGP